ncbi:hypothetical protein JNUCC0626_36445 [Lentzea sp. JNUCC 0626]|uniref:hypothetical protein n=1 Tax=Lentzea sp. JNUCC 0626 TaxID=3367513 RepID=UPI00374A6F32
MLLAHGRHEEAGVYKDGPPVPRIDPERCREFTMSGREVDYFMPVVCTDRGQHKRMLLTSARRELDGTHGMNHALQWFAPPMGKDAEPNSLTSKHSYIFRCPKCPRTPQVKADVWWQLVDKAVLARLDAIDISLLP